MYHGGQIKLSKRLGYSREHINRAIKELVDDELIKTIKEREKFRQKRKKVCPLYESRYMSKMYEFSLYS